MGFEVWEVALVLRKEILEFLRNRRTLFAMVIVPIVVYPVLFFGIGFLREKAEAEFEQRTIQVLVTGQDTPLFRLLESQEDIEWIPADGDQEAAVKDGNADLFLLLPATEPTKGKAVRAELTYSSAREASRVARRRVREMLEEARERWLLSKANEWGYQGDLTAALQFADEDLATEEERSGHLLGRIVPFLLILLTITGASFTAIESFTGEKERKTIESLISTALRRSSLIAGKFLAVVLASLFAISLNLLSLFLIFQFGLFTLPEEMGPLRLSPTALPTILLMMLPLCLFYSSLCILLASYAQNYKQAQLFILPLTLLSMLPAFSATLPGMSLSPFIALIPVVNIAAGLRTLLSGEANVLLLGIVFIATVFYSVLAIRKAVSLLQREEALFGIRRRARDAGPQSTTARQVYILVGCTMLLVYYAGSLLQQIDVLNGLILTETLLILLPAALFAFFSQGGTTKAIFSLRPVALNTLVGTLFLALSGLFLAFLLFWFQSIILPPPETWLEGFAEALALEKHSLLALLVVFALLPAVCEEAFFRGVFLFYLPTSYSKVKKIIIVSLAFGLFHLSIYRFVPTLALGVILTYLTLETGSIFPAILYHFANNASAFFLAKYAPPSADLTSSLGWSFFLLCVAIFLASLFLIQRGRYAGGPSGNRFREERGA